MQSTIYSCKDGDEFTQEGGYIGKHCIPYFESEAATHPAGVEMLETGRCYMKQEQSRKSANKATTTHRMDPGKDLATALDEIEPEAVAVTPEKAQGTCSSIR